MKLTKHRRGNSKAFHVFALPALGVSTRFFSYRTHGYVCMLIKDLVVEGMPGFRSYNAERMARLSFGSGLLGSASHSIKYRQL
jgi:hypothetical protein